MAIWSMAATAPRWSTSARWPGKTGPLKKTGNAAIAAIIEIAGLTVQVEADLPITDQTFADKFKQFEVDGPGSDTDLHPPSF